MLLSGDLKQKRIASGDPLFTLCFYFTGSGAEFCQTSWPLSLLKSGYWTWANGDGA
jgi:hypothetical protein